MDSEPKTAGRISRRDALRQGAILGGTFVWAAPAVQTLGMRGALAQQNGTPETADFCPQNEGTITRLEIRYTANRCDVVTGADPDALEGCVDFATDTHPDLPNTAWLVIQVGACPGNINNPCSNASMFGVEATAGVTVIDTGIPRSPQSSLRVEVYDAEGGTLLHRVQIHTSCSAELNLGEKFGAVEIFDGDWVGP